MPHAQTNQTAAISDGRRVTNSSGNELSVLEFQYSTTFTDIQVVLRNGEPWFVAADVCEILGLGNVTKALYGLDDDEKLTLPIVRAGQAREINFISESGLYALIIRSNKPTSNLK